MGLRYLQSFQVFLHLLSLLGPIDRLDLSDFLSLACFFESSGFSFDFGSSESSVSCESSGFFCLLAFQGRLGLLSFLCLGIRSVLVFLGVFRSSEHSCLLDFLSLVGVLDLRILRVC